MEDKKNIALLMSENIDELSIILGLIDCVNDGCDALAIRDCSDLYKTLYLISNKLNPIIKSMIEIEKECL